MSINKVTGFKVTSSDPIDDRLHSISPSETLAQYLLRVDTPRRYIGLGPVYIEFENKYYIFKSGIADIDFIEDTGGGGTVNPSNIQNADYIFDEDAGAINTLDISPSPAITSYQEGQTFLVQISNTNTGACTLETSGLGALPLTNYNGDALVGGELPAGAVIIVTNVSGTSFRILNVNNTNLWKTQGTTTLVNNSIIANGGFTLTFQDDVTFGGQIKKNITYGDIDNIKGFNLTPNIVAQTTNKVFDLFYADVITAGRTSTGTTNFFNFKKDGLFSFSLALDGRITTGGDIYATNANGFLFNNVTGSDTVPTCVYNRAFPSSGHGGVSGAVTTITSSLKRFSVNSGGDCIVETGKLYCNVAQSWALDNAAASLTNPTLVPHRGNFGNGLGGTTTILALITNSISALEIDTTQNIETKAGTFRLAGGNLIFADGINVTIDTTTGTIFGQSGSKIAFFGATAIAQPSHIVDADGTLADITTKFNTLLAQLASLGLQAAS